ncbi:MAG: (d)CMP kinase [Bacteroidales bacterium]|nr:(d)CMP kinase [Bacteroidales bacterium]MDD3430968.1 (d)CMP kinase [Bacteroidales bacterium]MDD4361556.1 (d)CMP kinase [Bacteroidales bacterium]
MEKRIIVAIDGHSSSGKSSMAKQLAKKHAYLYIDSGAMYRAVALYCLRKGWIRASGLDQAALSAGLKDIKISFCSTGGKLPRICLNGDEVENEIRGMEVSGVVSLVSAVPEVRSYLVDIQRSLAKDKGVVMDGRDIGTAVFPEAELKIFLTADASVRAKRRYLELKDKGMDASYEEILHNIEMRDKMDLNRKASPLRKADDAIELDNGQMSPEEQDAWLETRFNEAVYGNNRN